MISCSDYDYVEIVCMFHYPVKLELKSGDTLAGIARDTKRNEQKQECLELLVDDNLSLVVLDELVSITITKANPHFERVVLGRQSD